MPKFNCPHCTQSIDAPAEFSGSDANCPTCGKAIKVPHFEDSVPSGDLPTPPSHSPTDELSQRSTHTQMPHGTPSTNSGLAIASLVCGVVSLFTLIITGIPAVITGHIALGKIKRAKGLVRGSGMAITGLVLGYLSIAVLGIVLLSTPVIVKQSNKADVALAMNNAKILSLLLMEYEWENGSYPTELINLVDEGLMNQSEYEDLSEPVGWTYFAGQSSEDDSENYLIAADEPIGDARVVLVISGAVKVIPDSTYQANANLQGDYGK